MQVSRLGMPLVNEVVVPIGFKDYFNGSNPRGDAAFLPKVNDPELPHLISAVYGTLFPEVPDSNPAHGGRAAVRPGAGLPDRSARAEQAGTHVRPSEMLRLNMDIAPCTERLLAALGAIAGDVAGFPNGRRLTRRHHRHRAPRRRWGS